MALFSVMPKKQFRSSYVIVIIDSNYIIIIIDSLFGTNYSIQIAPMDCTGCEVCVEQCPDNALTMVSYEQNVNKQLIDWEYSIHNISNKGNIVAKGVFFA